jgi:hypothetical protein
LYNALPFLFPTILLAQIRTLFRIYPQKKKPFWHSACGQFFFSVGTASYITRIICRYKCLILSLWCEISASLYHNKSGYCWPWFSDSVSCSEKEKVEGQELQEWLKLVVAPTELKVFISGKQESLLPLQAASW